MRREENRDTSRSREPAGPLPCKTCGEATQWATLSAYGARCFRCYEAFCAKGISGMAQGYTDGRRDTFEQGQMRKKMRGDSVENVLKEPPVDAARVEALKRDAERRVAEYQASLEARRL